MYFTKKKLKLFKKRPKKKHTKLSFSTLLPKEIPKGYWLKKEMQEWLVKYSIQCDKNTLKIDLWKMIKKLLKEN